MHRNAENDAAHSMHTIAAQHKIAFSVLRKPELKSRRVFRGHMSKVLSAAWFTNGTPQFVSGAQDGKLIVWDASSAIKLHAVFCTSVWLTACGVSPSGRLLCSGDLHNTCSVFRVTCNAAEDAAIGDPQQRASIAKRPDGSFAMTTAEASSAADRGVFNDFALYKEMHGHVGFITGCRFLAENTLVTASSDATAAVWDVEAERRIATFAEHTQDISGMSVQAARSLVATASFDGTCRLFDVRKSGAVAVFRRPAACETAAGAMCDFTCLEFVPHGDQFVAGAADGIVSLFDVRARLQLASFGAQTPEEEEQHSPAGSSEAAAAAASSARNLQMACVRDEIGAVCTSASGRLIFAAGEGPDVAVWDAITGEKVAVLAGHENKVSCVAASPDGFSLLSGAWDGQLRLWF